MDGKTIAAIDIEGKVTDSKIIGIIHKNGDIDFGAGKLNRIESGRFNLSEKDFLKITPDNKKLLSNRFIFNFAQLFDQSL